MTLAFASLAAVLLLAAIAWAFLNGRSGGVLNNDPPPQTTAADAPAAASPEPRAAAQPTPSASAAVDEPAPADSSDFALPPASTNGARANAPDSGTASQPMRAGASTGDNAAVLRDSLGEWINATNAADLGAQMRFYAPTLERYYLRRGFTRDAVRGDKAALGKRARLRNVEIEDPQITVAPDNTTATMRFRKNYSFDDSPTRNAVLQELRWRRTPEGWRIISERDLRVLR